MKTILYECGICDCYHRWDFEGDCRNDEERYGSPEEFAEKNNVSIYDIEVRPWVLRCIKDGMKIAKVNP